MKIFLDPKFFCTTFALDSNFFGPLIYLHPKNVWAQIFLVSKNLSDLKFFLIQKFFNLNFWTQILFTQDLFGPNVLLPSSAPAPTPAKLGWDGHDLFKTCSWLVNDLFMACSRLVYELFITCSCYCSLLVHDLDLFKTCSWLVLNLFMTCSWLVHWFFMTCLDLFMTCSWIVHYLLTTFS